MKIILQLSSNNLLIWPSDFSVVEHFFHSQNFNILAHKKITVDRHRKLVMVLYYQIITEWLGLPFTFASAAWPISLDDGLSVKEIRRVFGDN